MIDCYMFATPNCWKVSIALEELELPYTHHWINVRVGEQDAPDFRAISPIGRVPLLVDSVGEDSEPVKIYGSAAILFYLAEKTGRLMPSSGRERAEALLPDVERILVGSAAAKAD